MNTIDLDGAIVSHNDDRTWAKAFVGSGPTMRVLGVSTEERWKPDALDKVLIWVKQQGIAVPEEIV